MKLDRTLNTKRNIAVGEIDKFIDILLPFIVRTMIIHFLATEYLGLMSLYYAIVQMLNLAEMGFGMAITFSMYKPIADDDSVKINALLKFYTKVYRVVGIIVLIVGLVIMYFLPHFISGSVPEDANIYLLYLVFLINTVLNYFVHPSAKALITAHHRAELTSKSHIITQIIMYIAQMLSVYFARDFYLYALTIPISTVAYNLLCARQAKKHFPQYYAEGDLDEEEYGEIKKQVIGLMIRKLATLSRNAFDSMFVSAFLGLGINAIYGNYYYVMDAIVMILAVVKTSMLGGVGNSIAVESKEKNLYDMNVINFLFMWIGGFCSICLLCLYQPFMKIWVGEEMMLPFGMAVMFSSYFYILKMGDIRTLYAEAAGIWWQARYLSILEAVANLLLNYLLVKCMGLYGIVLATMISYIIFNFIGGGIILFKHYFTQGGLGKYFLTNIKYIAVTGFVAVITYTVVSLVDFNGIVGLILKGLICAVVSMLLYLVIYIKTKEFKNAVPLIKAILR